MSGRDATQWALKKIAMPIVVSLGLLLALGYADATMNVELDLFLIYYMPVAIMAWCVGRGPGLLTALLGAGVWSWADVASGHTYSSEFFQYYNWALRGALLLIIAYAVARIKADLDSEKRLNAALAEALGEVKQLTGLLPICAWCKKIRDDGGYWQEVEAYISRHSAAQFSHGICPMCAAKQLPELGKGEC